MKQLHLILTSFLLFSYAVPVFSNQLDGVPAPGCPIQTMDGQLKINPERFKGRVTYVDFWASWCASCRISFPLLNELYQELHQQGFDIIAVNVDEELTDAQQFLTKCPVDFAIAMDPEGVCPSIYSVETMPTSFLIDRKGNVRYTHNGFKRDDIKEIRRRVSELLAEPQPTTQHSTDPSVVTN